MTKKKLFIIDAYALIYRFHYAFVSNPMRNSMGVNVSAVYGFVKFLYELIDRERPEYLGVAFDPKGPNFRHEMYEPYKANRDATPEDIITATPIIKSILGAMRIPILERPGFEADDVIGTLSHKACESGEFMTYMVTPDKDYGQLISECSVMYKPSKNSNGFEVWGVSEICTAFGIERPLQVIDILAIMGDSSDNIPGVMGIGEVGAKKLVAEWGSVEGIIENIESLKGATKTKIENSLEMMKLSKVLATICTTVPIEFQPEELEICEPDSEQLRAIFMEHNFRAFLQRMDSNHRHETAEAINRSGGRITKKSYSALKSDATQGSLFGDTETPGPLVATAPVGQMSAATDYQTIKTRQHTYMSIDTSEELRVLVDGLKGAKLLAIDTETTSLDTLNCKLLGVSLCAAKGEAYWVPMSVPQSTEMIGELLGSTTIEKIGQNLKFDLQVLKNHGIEVTGTLHDTMIMHYLLDTDRSHSLNMLARNFMGYQPIEIEELIGRGAKQLSLEQIAPAQLVEYACEDADIAFELYHILRPLLEEKGAVELYHQIEEPIIRLLAQMEMFGVKIDTEILGEIGTKLNAKLSRIEENINALSGENKININSPKQLGELLFDTLKINEKAKKTKTGQYKTDEATLEALVGKHPIVAQIIEYRGLKKLLNTYVEALPLLINPKSGRVHTHFNQALTTTGRLSSSNPNLQNIPIREELGREIRGAFVAQSEEWVIMAADYSQVELRIMAHLSGDEGLIEAFHQGLDVHTATAAKIYSVEPADVSAQQRRNAKMANFGIIYGISQYGLASRLEIANSEAAELINGYFELYPGVKKYMDQAIDNARQNGYVETLFGRRRYLGDVHSQNKTMRSLAERNAINAPIQGTAADIMKIAMIDVAKALQEQGLRSQISLQIHDEIVLEVPTAEIETATKIITEKMEGAATLKVPLVAQIGVAKSWKDAH